MDTQSVWDVLSSIPIGTVVAWITVICAIIAAICTGTVKLYKVFEKYKKLKDENEEQVALLYEHDQAFDDIKNSLQDIREAINEQREIECKRLRHDITKFCNRALADGYISMSILKSIEEMFEDYAGVLHGNSWVETLVKKVRKLPVMEDLDDE